MFFICEPKGNQEKTGVGLRKLRVRVVGWEKQKWDSRKTGV